MDMFIPGAGYVPYQGDVFEVIYDISGSEVVVTLEYINGNNCLPIDTLTGKEISDNLVYAEIKAWRKIR
jgi:hypothetical protein